MEFQFFEKDQVNWKSLMHLIVFCKFHKKLKQSDH